MNKILYLNGIQRTFQTEEVAGAENSGVKMSRAVARAQVQGVTWQRGAPQLELEGLGCWVRKLKPNLAVAYLNMGLEKDPTRFGDRGMLSILGGKLVQPQSSCVRVPTGHLRRAVQ